MLVCTRLIVSSHLVVIETSVVLTTTLNALIISYFSLLAFHAAQNRLNLHLS